MQANKNTIKNILSITMAIYFQFSLTYKQSERSRIGELAFVSELILSDDLGSIDQLFTTYTFEFVQIVNMLSNKHGILYSFVYFADELH